MALFTKGQADDFYALMGVGAGAIFLLGGLPALLALGIMGGAGAAFNNMGEPCVDGILPKPGLRLRHQVAGQLQPHKLIEWHIGIKCENGPNRSRLY